mgnify:CR=1 FL=1
MITPTKYMDLDLSIVRVASLIIKMFEQSKILEYREVLDYLIGKAGDDVKHVFVPALDFLYLLGIVEYHLHTDSIEFIGTK